MGIIQSMAFDASERISKIRQIDTATESSTATDVETMVHVYYNQVRRLSISILHNVDDADDATQETFISAARAIDNYRGDSSLKTWLFAIAINECRKLLRKQKRKRTLQKALQFAQSINSKPSPPEDLAIKSERERKLWAAVDELHERHRLPIILRYVHGLKAEEIAVALETNEGTVYSRLHYARRQLKEKLGEQQGG